VAADGVVCAKVTPASRKSKTTYLIVAFT